ncbi:hypothetical protein [Amycolatopsis sp. lyj-23]|uniref:hypothetical protein n=1 Tax=Amycolatopsis sp. lyj-23 TaxID=2789283 RepID=UPI00397E168A
MSEPTSNEGSAAAGEPEELAQQWLDHELSAYQDAQAGNLDSAIEKWNAILADDRQRTFFAEGGDGGTPDGPLQEIAAGLADAYLRKAGQDGDDGSRAKAMALVDEYHLELTPAGDNAGPNL